MGEALLRIARQHNVTQIVIGKPLHPYWPYFRTRDSPLRWLIKHSSRGYASSVRLSNLRRLEDRLKTLKSPAWPENVLPPINRDLAAAGRDVFVRNCRACHNDVARTGHRIVTTRVSISRVRTDPLAAENLMNARGKTGFLEGTRQFVYFGSRIGSVDSAYHITANTVVHLLLGKIAPRTHYKPSRRIAAEGAKLYQSKYEPQLQYKAPPLNGVWAAAPYLHNGAVPNLYEMLLPPDQRSKKFSVGRREFDPVKVGFVSEPAKAHSFSIPIQKGIETSATHLARILPTPSAGKSLNT